MKVFVVGGDGFCGWPCALNLADAGHEVMIVDSLVRRKTDIDLGVKSLSPIANIFERLQSWEQTGGSPIGFVQLDIATEYERLRDLLAQERPDSIVHCAEQRAAPYSMKNSATKRYTVHNNINGTHNLLCAIVETGLDIHVVHFGTMGVYGYGGLQRGSIPEGYLEVEIPDGDNGTSRKQILYPADPGSVYHMTKSLDQLLFYFYNKNDRVRVTDLHQGIVWGTNTVQTKRHPKLINRFDYDGDYGTVLNRFLMQSAIGYPLTVHGTGGQTRAFIHITDSVRCVQLALENPPNNQEKVNIFNQMTEVHKIRDLATKVAALTGAEISYLPNPRNEAAENELQVENQHLLNLGLKPTTLSEGLMTELVDVAKRFAYRCDPTRVPCTSAWLDKARGGEEEAMSATSMIPLGALTAEL
ncbi:NAD-dependent epimerase/dehydratase family protein [Mycobacterium gordonae]|uniref:NAD-dependent epimerase/dehydratase family protein n=1 Tax=Mycobacterium gordonae TaxID=1778 RepID=UPI00210A80B5|nr:NAD-dependent epimerase/dehydratase family protein [Mycobacterium gordonae]MCQ4365262.1 NAD-dependent epimerase/dehydratase family protein [Mycobacterium gordonae]